MSLHEINRRIHRRSIQFRSSRRYSPLTCRVHETTKSKIVATRPANVIRHFWTAECDLQDSVEQTLIEKTSPMVDPAIFRGLLISKMLGSVGEIPRYNGHLESSNETTVRAGVVLIPTGMAIGRYMRQPQDARACWCTSQTMD